MSGQISKEDRQQLERWIGLGPRDFELLYSISRDGCSPEIFHKLCDKQGPTLTVLYNTHGSVFGGYASSSWTNPPKDTLVQDENAFLFQLRFNNQEQKITFPVKNYPTALKACANRGPGFGSGRDFATFDSRISEENGKFKLDGYMEDPKGWSDYNNKGLLSKKDIMNDDLHVTELEVYKVTEQLQASTPAPWRKIKEESLDAQSELIRSLKPCKEQGISDFRVLLLGPTGSGKSSYVNTVRSTFMGRLSQKAACGLGPRGCTLAYTPYTMQTKDGHCLSLRLCDTPGLTENLGIVDVAFLLGGHVKDHHKFFAANQIDVESSDFVQKPQPGNKIHSVVFVVSVSEVNDPSTGLFEKLMEIKTMLNGKGIPYNTVLTKIDEVCENTEHVYKYAAAGEVVDKVAGKLGVSRNTVFPVKNYENEVELDEHVGALALSALKHILYSAADVSGTESVGETTESDVKCDIMTHTRWE